jgi:hypothetical protein
LIVFGAFTNPEGWDCNPEASKPGVFQAAGGGALPRANKVETLVRVAPSTGTAHLENLDHGNVPGSGNCIVELGFVFYLTRIHLQDDIAAAKAFAFGNAIRLNANDLNPGSSFIVRRDQL